MNYCLICKSPAVMFGSAWGGNGASGHCMREICHDCNESGRPYQLAEKPAEAHLNCTHNAGDPAARRG